MQLKDATILLVDDEPYYVEIATEWLAREGCRVLSAENGAAALPILEKNQVQAIITDIRMPRMDGIELVKHLKASGTYMPTAVALSGFSDLGAREAYDLGIECQLSKPVSRKVLIAAVQKAITDRAELWAQPFHSGKRLPLKVVFASLADALANKMIAFGRGGFCLRSDPTFPEDSAIEFHLSFDSEQEFLLGQGMVRWASQMENIMGIEIERVQEKGRRWLAQLAGENKTVSFIPYTPNAERTTSMR